MNVKRTGVKLEQEAHWRLVERVVALLEQAIAPGARVEHDVKLWDYEAGVPRQCDVVIWQGKPPRETLTIVEVQDRGRRVTLPTFEGWSRKREKVRAQHLVCVSQKGFSRSVLQEVQRQGDVVRLAELRDLEQTAWPLKFNEGKLPFIWPEVTMDSYSVKTVDGKMPAPEFKRRDIDLERNGRPVEIGQVFAQYFPTMDYPQSEGEYNLDQKLSFGRDDVLIMRWNGDSSRVDTVTAHLKVKVRRVNLIMSTSEYKQISFDGALAWAVTGTGLVDGQEAMLRAVFVPMPNGLLRPGPVQAFGAFEKLQGEIRLNYN